MDVKKLRKVPIFIGAFLVVIFAKPHLIGIVVGFILIALGEGIRIWAAGHLQKNEILTVTGPYAYGPKQVIWVAGAQKIVADLAQAFRRMWEHCVPLEDQRMKNIGYSGTTVSRILIYEKADPGRITLILVKEKLGF